LLHIVIEKIKLYLYSFTGGGQLGACTWFLLYAVLCAFFLCWF
jgi:hypothetical protein